MALRIDYDHLATLIELCEGDLSFLEQLVATIETKIPDQLEKVEAAIAQREFSALEFHAHKLKGAVGNIGLTGFAELAEICEISGRSAANLDSAHAAAAQMRAEVLECIRQVKQQLMKAS